MFRIWKEASQVWHTLQNIDILKLTQSTLLSAGVIAKTVVYKSHAKNMLSD